MNSLPVHIDVIVLFYYMCYVFNFSILLLALVIHRSLENVYSCEFFN